MTRADFSRCPECNARAEGGYGRMGGGMGPYWFCTRQRPKPCSWFFKQQECPCCEGIMAADGSCPDCGDAEAIKAKMAARFPTTCKACGRVTKTRTAEGKCGNVCSDGEPCGGEGSP